jgi:hypothetical protein
VIVQSIQLLAIGIPASLAVIGGIVSFADVGIALLTERWWRPTSRAMARAIGVHPRPTADPLP